MKPVEAPIARDAQVEVPGLGTVTGLRFEGICQYLGIPYGEIPGRFRRSIVVTEWENGRWDGTKLGPYCPQPPRDFYPVPTPSRPWLESPTVDELNCLNLNISVPQTPSEPKSGNGLPVMVFLHGGAFAYSTGSSPIYDGRILAGASRSVLSRPTINYRLGVYGFLAGSDLKQYGETVHGEQGTGNYGIWDQVIALRWVQKHIAAFGGDPNRVTLFGQSAGSVSVHCHLLRDEALFSAAILNSGMIRLCGVLSVAEHQVIFEKMLRELGIPLGTTTSWRDRVEALLAEPTEAVTKAMVPVFIIPVITMSLCDDDVLIPRGIPKASDYCDSFEAPAWCRRIMLGDCRNETIIWNKSWANLSEKGYLDPGSDMSSPTAPRVWNRMVDIIGEEKTKRIAAQYQFTADLSPDETFQRLERMTSHGIYSLIIYFATKSFAASGASVYAWHFDVPSPFDNAWKGYAHHSLDNVLLWGIFGNVLPDSYKDVSHTMQEAWIKFANGEEPWESFGEKKRWKTFHLDGSLMKAREDDDGWGYSVWEDLHAAGLAQDLSDLSVELCLRNKEVTCERECLS